MLHAALDLQLEVLTYYLNGATLLKSPTSLGSMIHPGPYGIYQTKDSWLALSMSPLPALQAALPSLQPALQDVLTALVRRSPQETLYYLKQILASSSQVNTARLIRRLLPLFSPENQASLRQALVSRPGIRPA